MLLHRGKIVEERKEKKEKDVGSAPVGPVATSDWAPIWFCDKKGETFVSTLLQVDYSLMMPFVILFP
jgi:hypothetical protein